MRVIKAKAGKLSRSLDPTAAFSPYTDYSCSMRHKFTGKRMSPSRIWPAHLLAPSRLTKQIATALATVPPIDGKTPSLFPLRIINSHVRQNHSPLDRSFSHHFKDPPVTSGIFRSPTRFPKVTLTLGSSRDSRVPDHSSPFKHHTILRQPPIKGDACELLPQQPDRASPLRSNTIYALLILSIPCFIVFAEFQFCFPSIPMHSSAKQLPLFYHSAC